MKTFALSLISCACLMGVCLSSSEKLSEPDAFKLAQVELKNISFEAVNVYEAVNLAMMKGAEEDADIKKIWLKIGPFKPRGNEGKTLKLKIDKVTLWDLLRYCAEHFRLRLSYKEDTIILDENWVEKLGR